LVPQHFFSFLFFSFLPLRDFFFPLFLLSLLLLLLLSRQPYCLCCHRFSPSALSLSSFSAHYNEPMSLHPSRAVLSVVSKAGQPLCSEADLRSVTL